MARAIIRNEDFKGSSTPTNVQGIYYRGEGFPIGRIVSPYVGALYLDNLSGQLWICSVASSTASTSWIPFYSNVSTGIRIDTDVFEGDFVGIYGAGSWAASNNLTISRMWGAASGVQNASFVAGGQGIGGVLLNTSELFNGTSWFVSGNLSASKRIVTSAGTQNSGIVCGGYISAAQAVTELFDGSTWATSGLLNVSRVGPVTFGTSTAALASGGYNGSTNTTSTEVFNGTNWYSVGGNLSFSKQQSSGLGAQNAGVGVGGTVDAGGSLAASTSTTELYNGTAWSSGAYISMNKYQTGAGGTQVSGFITGGLNSAGTFQTGTELFNGSVWSLSGSLAIGRGATQSAGTQGNAMTAGGQEAGTLITTELHTQSIYRKLNYSNMQHAKNIGMAYNVSSSSLTASIMRGDLPSTVLPVKTFFGIDKANTSQTYTYLSSLTGTVTQIVASSGLATIQLNTALTNGLFVGAGILIKSAGNLTGSVYPIVANNTQDTVIVRWENASTTLSPTSFTWASVYLGRFNNLAAASISVSAGVMNINLTKLDATSLAPPFYVGYQQFLKFVKVGQVVSIPYSNVSGSNGSPYNYGTYVINSVTATTDAGPFTVSVTSVNTISTSEVPGVPVGGIKIYQNTAVSPVCLDSDTVVLGFSNKMHNTMRPFNDDLSNGII